MRALCLAISLLCLCSYACADVADGNKLLERCKNHGTEDTYTPNAVGAFNEGMCIGYISGIKDALRMAAVEADKSGSIGVCFPEGGIPNGEAVLVVIKWLKDHPEKLHEPAIALTVKAFQKAFPCK